MRNSFGFQPLAEYRGLPEDVAEGVRTASVSYPGPEYSHSTTWITGAELAAADWDETDSSRAHSHRAVAEDATHWGPVWEVMRTLGGLHGPENVRLVVWFD
ncbi:hypothetical protein ACFPC0_20430 [Streptomyces andamanensis]|uniref:Uncharacterized protein n=1 Tax=Streptomyces andamanensis TaxID=1565035 RepID=A0ABV8THC8_9ACTN